MPRRNLSKITATTTTALLLAVVLSSVVLATDTPKERTQPRPTAARPFVPSEELVYEGEFTRAILRGINIAELRFKAQRPMSSGVTVEGDGQAQAPAPLVLTTDVISKGFFSKLFGVTFKFHAESQVEPNDFYALRTTKKDEQGKRVRTSEAVFDQESKKVEYTERDPNNAGQAPLVITAVLDGPTQDIVSAIYFLRTQPLAPGQTFNVAISD